MVICQWEAPLEYSWDRAAAELNYGQNCILFLSTVSTYPIYPYKVHTVACSMHKIGIDYFAMTVHLGFWSSCCYTHHCLSATFGSTYYLHLNVLWSIIAVSVILSNELSSISKPLKVSVLLALFMFLWNTVMYDLSLAAQRIVCQNSKKSMLTCTLQDELGHTGIFGILHFTSFTLTHTVQVKVYIHL